MKDLTIHEIISAVDPATRIPYGVSRYYASLAENENPDSDPIAAQYIPRPQEQITLPEESSDPIADEQYSVSPRVIHHYHDRILILVNDRCATYCRHCFRRHFTGSSDGRISSGELDAAAEYLKKTPQVQEVLLSGGDPLMMSDRELSEVIIMLKNAVPGRRLLFRLASRMPVVLPSRITRDLVQTLSAAADKRLWVVTHANHPRELTPEFEQAVSRFVDGGIPVLNQAVLLRGINNSADTLEALFRGLIQMRVKPYYLFQGDLAAGTSHFRTGINEGLDLMDELRSRLSGMAMPTYAVDLPGGGGKIPLTRETVSQDGDAGYILKDRQGRVYRYPREQHAG
ncbi:KamA family radical SAM protein [Salinispira pacifica]|uniref:KamA family radical SAM protein n=1 Tax=Salinispira pacifica TaxID=1307761 RepID=UPI001FCC8BE9|nr:KamA family radical SAM protein [Salinispira pacifica]